MGSVSSLAAPFSSHFHTTGAQASWRGPFERA
jgi:hypothetical protein